MKRMMLVKSLEQLRTISDPLRVRILMNLFHQEATGKQLSTVLEMSASKVHYHLQELEKHGFIEVVRTETKNGIVQRFYRASALDYVVDEDLLPSMDSSADVMQEIIISQLKLAIARTYEAPESSFTYSGDRPRLHGMWEVKAPKDEIQAWIAKYRKLTDELKEIEWRHRHRVAHGEAKDPEEIFFMIGVGFMTSTEYFGENEADGQPNAGGGEANE